MGFSGTISAAAAILLFGGAHADKAGALQDALQVCLRVPEPADRLACFEGVARSSAPAANGQAAKGPDQTFAKPPTTASEQRAATKEKRRRAESRGDEAREAYDAVVLRAWEYGNGEYYIALTNGEIWKCEARDKGRPVKDREQVELRPGAMGAWFMSFKTLKRPTIRVSLVE